MSRGPIAIVFRVVGLAVAVTAAAAPALSADRIPMPPLGQKEQGEYRARELRSGAELWRTQWVLSRESKEGRPILHLSEEGRRLRESIVPAAWTVRMMLDLWGQEPRLSSVREGRDAAGRAVHVEQRDFDYGAGWGKVTTTDLGTGQAETRTFRLTLQSITGELLPAALRLLPAAPDRQMRFDLVTRGGLVVGMQAKMAGRERVEVPAGSFECFKVELDPTGFLGLLADLIMPRLFMWQTVAAPHFWVMYQGPEGGLGSRQIVRELVGFQSEPR